jgi:hypothetical protein
VLLGAVAAVLFIVEWIWKPFRAVASFCWVRMKGTSEPRGRAPITDLRCVVILPLCFWSIGKRGDQPCSEIVTHWNVTNISKEPVRLLTARLEKPRVRDPGARDIVCIYDNTNEIRPGATCEVSFHFFVALRSQKPGDRLTLRIIAVDQFANEQRLPPITLTPFIAKSGT